MHHAVVIVSQVAGAGFDASHWIVWLIGDGNIFATEDQAIAAFYERLGDAAADDLFCVPPRA